MLPFLPQIGLVTDADVHRRPAANFGQILRALILIAVTALGIAAVMRPSASQAAEGFDTFVEASGRKPTRGA